MTELLPVMFLAGSPGPLELVVLFAVILVLFGPRKLPEIARAVGRAMRELRRASDEFKTQVMAIEETVKETLDDPSGDYPDWDEHYDDPGAAEHADADGMAGAGDGTAPAGEAAGDAPDGSGVSAAILETACPAEAAPPATPPDASPAEDRDREKGGG